MNSSFQNHPSSFTPPLPGVTGVVTATSEALNHGQAWIQTAVNAKGDKKKIKSASLELIHMLEFLALAAVAAAGGKANNFDPCR